MFIHILKPINDFKQLAWLTLKMFSYPQWKMAWKALLGWPHVRYSCMLGSWSFFPRSDPSTLKPSIPFILQGQHAQEGAWCSGKKNPLIWPRTSGKQGYPVQRGLSMAAHQEEGKGDGAQCLEDPYLGVMGTWAGLRLNSENRGKRCLRSVGFQIRRGVWAQGLTNWEGRDRTQELGRATTSSSCEAGNSEEKSQRLWNLRRQRSDRASFSCFSRMPLDKLLNFPEPWFLHV